MPRMGFGATEGRAFANYSWKQQDELRQPSIDRTVSTQSSPREEDLNRRLKTMADSEAGGKEAVPENAQDLTIFVQNLLEQMQNRFNQMSTSIIGRIDEMGNRIDDLEKSINDLMQQAGIDAEKPQDEGK